MSEKEQDSGATPQRSPLLDAQAVTQLSHAVSALKELIEAANLVTMEWRLHGQLTDSCRVLERAVGKAEKLFGDV